MGKIGNISESRVKLPNWPFFNPFLFCSTGQFSILFDFVISPRKKHFILLLTIADILGSVIYDSGAQF